MNFLQLLNELERQLDEIIDNPIQWTETEFKQYINDAQMDILIDAYDFSHIPLIALSTQTVSTTASTATYTFGTAPLLPTRILYNKEEIFPCVVEDLDRDNADWRNNNPGTPRRFVWVGETIIFLEPKPDTSSKEIRMDFLNYPTTMTATNDNPQIPKILHRAMVYRAAIEALGSKGLDPTYFTIRYRSELQRYQKLEGKKNIRQNRLIPVPTKRDRAFSGMRTR